VIIADSFEGFPVPPPMSSMGINPCIPGNVQNNGDNDGLSSITASLSYETYETTYFATGATEIENTTISGSVASPTHVLNQGVTTFHYIVEDFAGNIDTCDFNITVEDNEDPVALCGATNVTIDPSGLSSDIIEASDIDLGSFDNCEIVSMNVTANPITCDMIGDTMSVMLTVADASGNEASCQTFVQVIGEQPMPTYSIGPCGNDSLYLFANPPDVQGGINPWQFSWTSSTGFVSSQENPIIPNASGDDAGSYTVTIQGLTGCVASGEVQVAIEDLPITPTIAFQDNAICSFDDIVMTTDPVPGGSTIYQWYSGQAPSGTLIATTAVPSYTVNGPFMEGDSCYYVVAVRDGCASSPSASKCVEITGQPTALTNDDIIDVCEGGTVELGTPVTGPGITYSWTGPNFASNLQIPAPITNITLLQDGLYSLVISKNGCESEPAFTVVNVLDAPNQPLVTNTTTAQNPACVGDTVTLFANITNADSYEWTSPFFDTFVTNVSQLVLEDITSMQEGNWTVIAFYNVCASPQSDGSFIFVEDLPNASFSVNSPVCSNEDLILDATTIPGAVYEWELPSGSIVQGEVVTVSPPQAGEYELTVTSAQGCKNTDSETVVVNPAPVVTAISNNAPTCPEGPTDILLTATIFPPDDGSYEYLWLGDGFMSTDSVGIIPAATANDNGPYVLTVTNSFECTSNQLTTTVDMGEILQTPATPALGEPNPYCEGDNVELTTIDVYNGMIETYYWHLPNGQGVITTPNPSLELNNLTLNNTGNYFVVVEVDGCFTDTSAVRFVQVNPIPVAEAFSNSPVCEGDVIQFSTDCLAGNVQYLWNGDDFNSTICSPIIPNATEDNSGTYELTVTVNGCTSSTVSTNVFVNEVPGTPIINSSGDICIDDPDAQLVLTISTGSATQGASYIWLDQNMDTIAPVGPALVAVITDFSGYVPGLNTFFVQAVKNGCTSDFSIPVTLNFSETPNQNADAGPDLQICDGQAAEMEAVAPQVGTGTWELIDGNPTGVAITNPNDPGTTITGLQLGETYLFEWSLSNGPCDEYSSDVVEVFVGILEQANAGEMIDTCAVSSVKLDPVLPSVGMGTWCQPEAQEQLGVIILEPNNPNTTVGGLVPGNDYIFIWKLPDMGCGESTDEVIVRVIDDFVYAGEDFEDCGDGCTELDAIPPEVGQGEWSSPNGAINFSDVNDPMATACGLEAGINKLVWVSNQGICGDDGADTLQVFYQLNPIAENDVVQVPFAGEAFFQPDSNDFKPDDYFIEFSSEPINGVITALPGGIYSYEANINFVGVEEVTYLICSELCECSEGIIRFEVGQAAKCIVPNIITPNGDGINDAFIIPCLANDQKYPANEVAIFNQWGDEVFREAPYTNSWEGTYDGESLPSGTYFYIILFGEDEDPQTGFLVIQQ
jgi:gliding motility-associated-like protein